MQNLGEDAPDNDRLESEAQVRAEDRGEENQNLEGIENAKKSDEDIEMHESVDNGKAGIDKPEEGQGMDVDKEDSDLQAPSVHEDQSTPIDNKIAQAESQTPEILLDQDPSSSHPKPAPSSNFNFNSISCDFQSESVLILDGKPFEHPKLSYKFRSLQISSTEILFTGQSPSGIFKLCILDITNRNLKELDYNLISTRELHAMSFINNNPAIIGGIENTVATSSVQVYSNGSFIEYPSLKQPRYGHSAVFHKLTWVFGGAVSESSGANLVECFRNHAWSSFSINHEFNSVGLGLVSHSDRILILGGFGLSKNCSSSVYVFTPDIENPSESKLSPNPPLAFPCSFSLNLWKLEDATLTSHSFMGKKVIYEVK